MAEQQSEGAVHLRIVRGPVDSLSLYEITDYELELFEQGAPSSTFLNFAIMFSSIGVSFLVTLLTVGIESWKIFTAFVVLATVGLSLSLVLYVLWYRSRSRVKDLCVKIRARVPTAPVTDAAPGVTAPDGPTESGG